MKHVVLLIEDDPSIGELYETILEQNGYTITWAKNGEEGSTQVTPQTDLILLDIMMPKKNGVDVLKDLKKNPTLSHIPVLILSNFAHKSVVDECKALGARGYLLKVKLLPHDLSHAVQTCLEHPEQPLSGDWVIFSNP